jgi:hypothetical protein
MTVIPNTNDRIKEIYLNYDAVHDTFDIKYFKVIAFEYDEDGDLTPISLAKLLSLSDYKYKALVSDCDEIIYKGKIYKSLFDFKNYIKSCY